MFPWRGGRGAAPGVNSRRRAKDVRVSCLVRSATFLRYSVYLVGLRNGGSFSSFRLRCIGTVESSDCAPFTPAKNF